ncbi:MAG: hypothetical protein Q9186_001347 [Xanthomendoza sp. 1 TL-2023]
MSKYDAERAFKIYKTFSKQTDQVVQFLSVARQYENATRLEIPKLKHAPTSLTSSLEEYLNDPDFEINKRQYLAQQEAKKGGKSVPKAPAKFTSGAQKPMASKDFPEPTPIVAPQRQEPKGPAPDLIDFFDSIEQKQQPMAIQPQQTPSSQTGQQYLQQPQSSTFFSSGQGPYPQDGLSQQPQQQQQTANFIGSNPYSQVQNVVHQPVQLDFSGAGVSGYPQQQQFGQPQNQSIPNAIQQNSTPQGLLPQQQQPFNTGQLSQPSSNPFRQVSMPTGSSTSTFTPSSAVSSPLHRQSTNPFARNIPTGYTGRGQSTHFASPQPQPTSQAFPQQPPQPFPQPNPQPFQQQPSQSMQPQPTGTNPFARNLPPTTSQTSTPPPPLLPNVTGSTNPFRQSTVVNQPIGPGWQSNQATMGGLEQLDTVPVFPRPGQLQQPHQQQSPWS